MYISSENCQKIIYRYTKNHGIYQKSKINPLSESPLGFLGDHHELVVTYLDKHTDEIETISFFLKSLPKRTESQRDYVNGCGVFRKESMIYQNLVNEYVKYFPKQIVPKCYLIDAENFIILENLTKMGYKIVEYVLKFEEFEVLFKALAKFHAGSIIFEEERSKLYGGSYRINEHYILETKETTYVQDPKHPRFRWTSNVGKVLEDTIPLLPGYSLQNDTLEKLCKLTAIKIFEYIQPSKYYRNVLLHGDLWKNNFMLNMKEKSAVLIDFQFARYAPPALDFLLTFYINSKRDFAENHFIHFANLYYNEFCDSLQSHGINPDEIYGRDTFFDSLSYYKLPALLETTMYATNIFLSKDFAMELLMDEMIYEEFAYTNRSKYILEEIQQNPKFREPYFNMLSQFVECLDSTKF